MEKENNIYNYIFRYKNKAYIKIDALFLILGKYTFKIL
mgnify:CR=1 FL=1